MSHSSPGKTAIVIGASRGIGAEIARRLGAAGKHTLLCARSGADLEQVAAQVRAAGGSATVLPLDVRSTESVQQLQALLDNQALQTDEVHYVSGIIKVGTFESFEDADWLQTFDVNVMGAVRCLRILLPRMKASGGGRVVVIASTAALHGSMYQSPYNVSKHGVLGLVRCLAREYSKDQISINAVCPGFVDTPMLHGDEIGKLTKITGASRQQLMERIQGSAPMGRVVTPEEVAELSLYLGSSKASAITGRDFVIDAGLLL